MQSLTSYQLVNQAETRMGCPLAQRRRLDKCILSAHLNVGGIKLLTLSKLDLACLMVPVLVLIAPCPFNTSGVLPHY